MENLSKRILALLFAVVIIFPLVTTPVFALGEPTTGFWEWIPGFTPGGSFGGGGGRGDEAREEYKKYVQTLPASGYTSDGGLIWYPTVSDCTSFEYYYSDGSTSKQTFEELPYTYYVSSSDSVFTASNSRSINLRRLPSSSKTSFSLRRIGFIFNIRAPLTGSYSQETSFLVLIVL